MVLIVGQHTFFVSAVRSIRFVRSALISELVEVFGLPSLVRSIRCLLIRFCNCRHEMKSKFVCKLNFGVDVKFFGSRQPLGYNVFAVYFCLGIWNIVYRNITNKAIILLDICKAKIISFRGSDCFCKCRSRMPKLNKACVIP